MFFAFKIIFLVLKFLSLVLCESPIVKTSYGYLRGSYMSSREGRIFSTFLGIPYAAPPTGKLRFKPPVSPAKWEGVRNATQEANICSQGKYGGEEDCLYLNVFSHQVKNGTLLPVMFYIHGGSFYMGSPELGITGPEFFMDRDIVLVTIHYRLGPFGFLSTGDFVIPGNMGLKDQLKALTWVRENIQFFGGNPDDVTLFGCSVGASSVHLHMQSRLSQDLFKRAISQSGTALNAFAITAKGAARKSMLQFSQILNCNSTNSSRLLECLQLKTTQEIENAHKELQSTRYAMTKSIFRPVVEDHNENAFITENPFFSTTQKPWLTGITANEGILDIQTKYLNYTIEKLKQDAFSFIPKALLFEDLFSNPQKIVEHILKFYFKNSSRTSEMIASFEKMSTDWWYLWPLEQAIRRHNGTLFYYLYDHLGEHSYVDIYNSPKGFGVSHLDDLISLFNHSRYFKSLNAFDKNISKLIIDCWVNFATYGDPTPVPISRNPQSVSAKDFRWEEFDRNRPKHIHIQTDLISMIEGGIYPERLRFWKSIPILYKMDTFDFKIVY